MLVFLGDILPNSFCSFLREIPFPLKNETAQPVPFKKDDILIIIPQIFFDGQVLVVICEKGKLYNFHVNEITFK